MTTKNMLIEWGNSAVIIHLPHAGTACNEAAADGEYIVPMEQKLALHNDFSDPQSLLLGKSLRAAMIVRGSDSVSPHMVINRLARQNFDPERFASGDAMAAKGLGVVFTHDANGVPWRGEKEARQDGVALLMDYECEFDALVESVLSSHGLAFVLSIKTYPMDATPYELDPSYRPELCIGTDSFHSPARLSLAFMDEFEDSEVNAPFKDAYLPSSRWRVDPSVQALSLVFRRDAAGAVAAQGAADRVASLLLDAEVGF